MKKLISLIFMITSLTGFSQEEKKGTPCSAGCHLLHESGDASTPDDHFMLDGFYLNNPLFYGGFHTDSVSSTTSTVYSITLPIGDSLLYSAYWFSDGVCYSWSLSGAEEVDSIFTILEGVPVPIIHEGYFGIPNYYSLSQKAVIRNPCLIQIKSEYGGGTPYLIRVKFQDPPLPLDLPEITNDISLWLSGENTLTIKADQDAVWEMNLYSLSGQMIQKNRLEGSQDLDVSNLPKGCYIARVSSENGLTKQLKFIK